MKRVVPIVCMYVLSLCLPAIDFRDSRVSFGEVWWGAQCVYIPFMVIIPAWWANIVLWIGLFVLGKGRFDAAFVLGILATVVALLGTLQLSERFLLWSNGRAVFPLRIGYFVWLACDVSLLFAARHGLKASESSQNATEPEHSS